MRAFLLPFLFALLCAVPAKVMAADSNDGLRQYLNGSWQLVFREDVKDGGTGSIKSVATIITITLRYDGTRTITMDEQLDNQPLVRASETNDFYRVDELDGTNFTLTSWTGTEPPKVTNRRRTGADTMMAEGSDAVYQRVANTQEGLLGPMPPQREAQATPPPPPQAPPVIEPPVASPGTTTPDTTQEARDTTIRAYMVGRWTASLTKGGQSIESILDYDANGQLSGTQSVTANGQTQNYSVKGTYTIASTDERNFTLTFNIPGFAPISTDLQIVDQNTLFNPKENYRAVRTR